MSASNAGAHLIPNSFVGMIGSLGTGLIVRRTHKYYWLNTFCACFGVIGSFLISTWEFGTSEWVLWIKPTFNTRRSWLQVSHLRWMLWTNMSFTSFSMGAVTTLTIVALIADVGPEHVAIATSREYLWRPKVLLVLDLTYFLSVSYVFRTIGQVLGVALSGALTQAVLARELEKRIQGHNAEEVSCIPRDRACFWHLGRRLLHRPLRQSENHLPLFDICPNLSSPSRLHLTRKVYMLSSFVP